ncbi:SsgA family sporulation/cell division regulator [Streptomyces sp. NPDC058440]|uniref:SsgA family sporulation/cell division regulator n=1 Tax=Streptomyces sp. NPDC058440 TaxID=3346501 RepID=UPI003650C641
MNESFVVPVYLDFHYATDEPYTVQMTVDTGLTPPVEWLFARDLLTLGLERPAGLGDVRTYPAPREPHQLEAGEGAIHIWIRSSAGSATVSAPARTVRRFLDRTFRKVATGSEGHLLKLDESIVRLMTAQRSEDGTP